MLDTSKEMEFFSTTGDRVLSPSRSCLNTTCNDLVTRRFLRILLATVVFLNLLFPSTDFRSNTEPIDKISGVIGVCGTFPDLEDKASFLSKTCGSSMDR